MTAVPKPVHNPRGRYYLLLHAFGPGVSSDLSQSDDPVDGARWLTAVCSENPDADFMVDVEDLRSGGRQRLTYSAKGGDLDIQALSHPERPGDDELFEKYSLALNEITGLALNLAYAGGPGWKNSPEPPLSADARRKLHEQVSEQDLLAPMAQMARALRARDEAADRAAERLADLIEESEITAAVSVTGMDEDTERAAAVAARLAAANSPEALAAAIEDRMRK